MATRNKTIDLFKYMASILIIAIHTKLFFEINSILNFVTVDIVCRLAVPFFAICSGYFMTRKFENKHENSKDFFCKHWKKLFVIYIVWTFIYLIRLIPEWIEINWFSINAFVDYGIATVISKPYYHMWYLLSTLYAIPIFALCLKYVKKNNFKWLIIILWVVKVLSYGFGTPPAVQIISLFKYECVMHIL